MLTSISYVPIITHVTYIPWIAIDDPYHQCILQHVILFHCITCIITTRNLHTYPTVLLQHNRTAGDINNALLDNEESAHPRRSNRCNVCNTIAKHSSNNCPKRIHPHSVSCVQQYIFVLFCLHCHVLNSCSEISFQLMHFNTRRQHCAYVNFTCLCTLGH